MQHQTVATPSSRDIRLDLLSMTEWRVCDRRRPAEDPTSVLGFIERKGFVYEVTMLSDPAHRARCGSLASATAAFCQSVSETKRAAE
jgi:hypothetical protein